jgi:dolichol kinase
MKKELLRKAIHILFGVIILLLIHFTGTTISTQIIFLCLFFGTIISIAITKGYKFPLLNEIVFKVERENEKHFPGKAAIMFFLSALILLIIFKTDSVIVLASLSVQVFADSAAALIGTKYGKHKLYKKKSREGSLACLITAIICLSFFYPLNIAIIAGIIATIVEILPGDDNLFVPLITATTIRALI